MSPASPLRLWHLHYVPSSSLTYPALSLRPPHIYFSSTFITFQTHSLRPHPLLTFIMSSPLPLHPSYLHYVPSTFITSSVPLLRSWNLRYVPTTFSTLSLHLSYTSYVSSTSNMSSAPPLHLLTLPLRPFHIYYVPCIALEFHAHRIL